MSQTKTKRKPVFIIAAIGALLVILYVATGFGLVTTGRYCTKCGRVKIDKEIALLELWGIVEGPFTIYHYSTKIRPTKLSAYLDAHFGPCHRHTWRWRRDTERGLWWTAYVSAASSPLLIGDLMFDVMNLSIGTLLSDAKKAALYRASLDSDDPAARAVEEILRETVGPPPEFDERVKQILRKYGFLAPVNSVPGG